MSRKRIRLGKFLSLIGAFLQWGLEILQRKGVRNKWEILTFRTNEENLNESDINETSKIISQEELEEEYIDFPDPLEYLIGYYAAKNSSLQKYKPSSKLSSSQVSATVSPKKKPPVVSNRYSKDVDSKMRYKSYYNSKRPNRPDSDINNLKKVSDSWIKGKYRVSSQLNSSYERPNIFNKSKNSTEEQIHYSEGIDDERLCRTLGEDQMMQKQQENSVKRSSIEKHSVERKSVERPIFDPYSSSRSHGYELSASLSKENTFKPFLHSSSKNSYDKIKNEFGFEASQSGISHSQ